MFLFDYFQYRLGILFENIWHIKPIKALHKRSRIRKCNISSYSLEVMYFGHTLGLPLLGNASELSQGVSQFITTNYLCDFSHTLIIPMSTLTMLEKYSTQAAFISRGLVPWMLRPAHYLQTMISHTMIDPSSVACNSQVALLPAPQSQSWNLSPLMVQQSTAYGYSANWAWLCTRRVLKLRFQSSLLFPINHLPPICQWTYICTLRSSHSD